MSRGGVKDADFLRGRFSELVTGSWQCFTNMKDISLEIGKERYRRLLVEADGRFAALKEGPQ